MESNNSNETNNDDTPINNFSGCHDGIIKAFHELLTLIGLLKNNQDDPEVTKIAKNILVFFEEVVLVHHAEEEEELFTAVMDCASTNSISKLAREYTKRLVEEHRDLEEMWHTIEPGLKDIAKGKHVELDLEIAEKLSTQYLAHAAFEEQYYLPLSAKILSKNEKSALGLALHMRHQEKATNGYI